MRKMRNGAVALALVGALAACSDDGQTTDGEADADATPTAAASPECRAIAYPHDSLAPGCWAIQVRGLADSPLAELDLPAGFAGNDAWVWVNPEGENEWGAIVLTTAEGVHHDPCTRNGTPAEVGPSVEDLAAALTAQKVTRTTRPTPVSVGGHDGLYLEMSVPTGFDFSSCRGREVSFWEGPESPGVAAGESHYGKYWLLDVDGHRVVLAVHLGVDATPETVELFTGIAESATFAGA